MANLTVPEDFGNIELDPSNAFLPYKVQAVDGVNEDGTISYSDIGHFSSFQKALLALIIVNSNENKNKAYSSTPPETALAVDKLYYSTLSEMPQGDTSEVYPNSSYFDKEGNLVIGLGSTNKPIIHNTVHNAYTIQPNMRYLDSNIEYDNPYINLTFKAKRNGIFFFMLN